ncbi:MAG: photosynthetic reaction center cytochrome PufC [Tagaea sp.]
MIGFNLRIAGFVAALAVGAVVVTTFGLPPVDTRQTGVRGTGMEQIAFPADLARLRAANRLPEITPPLDPSGEKSSAVYENVKVLGDLDSNEFLRLMTAITEWVSPEQGCAYCHEDGNLASDSVYQKVVARRMLQMTREINGAWRAHVGDTGVTCFTCHRGQPVPSFVWFNPGRDPHASAYAGGRADGQNRASRAVGLTSLPENPFAPFLSGAENIRVQPTTALPVATGATIQRTEATYGLMMHMSDALGVNCTQCHNTQSLKDWQQAGTTRATAWHGIRMARDLNNVFLDPLRPSFPAERLGPEGDVAKVNCATCHQGANKPLLGQSHLKDYLSSLRP